MIFSAFLTVLSLIPSDLCASCLGSVPLLHASQLFESFASATRHLCFSAVSPFSRTKYTGSPVLLSQELLTPEDKQSMPL